MITAMLMVGLELFSTLRNQRTHFSETASELWDRLYRWRWAAGAGFAALSLVMGYSVAGGSGTYEVVGFPLVVAMVDEAGRNYVGRLSMPFLVANAAIWFFFPHILLYLWSVLAGYRR